MPPKRSRSSLPDVGKVAREAAGDDEHRIDADVVAGSGVASRELLGRCGDPAQPVAVEREVGGFAGGALLDLDEGDDTTAAGDQIDLAAVHPHALPNDAPTAKAKPPCSQCFGAAAAALGERAVQLSAPSSSARA